MSDNVVSAKKGSSTAQVGCGIRHMSDSLIAFQPAIEEPSNIMPSAKVSSSIIETSKVTCCHLPRGSVKRKSAYFTSLSLIIFMTFFGVVMAGVPFRGVSEWPLALVGIQLSAKQSRKRSNQQFRWHQV